MGRKERPGVGGDRDSEMIRVVEFARRIGIWGERGIREDLQGVLLYNVWCDTLLISSRPFVKKHIPLPLFSSCFPVSIMILGCVGGFGVTHSSHSGDPG